VINTEVLNFVELATKYVLLGLNFFLPHFPEKFPSQDIALGFPLHPVHS
jgi:hypothetical protein